MGRLIDANVLREEVNSWGMNDYEPSDFTDALDDSPTVEAIPKDQYETRLKADLEAILVEIQLEIEEKHREEEFMNDWNNGYNSCLVDGYNIIQQKIDKLKGEEKC